METARPILLVNNSSPQKYDNKDNSCCCKFGDGIKSGYQNLTIIKLFGRHLPARSLVLWLCNIGIYILSLELLWTPLISHCNLILNSINLIKNSIVNYIFNSIWYFCKNFLSLQPMNIWYIWRGFVDKNQFYPPYCNALFNSKTGWKRGCLSWTTFYIFICHFLRCLDCCHFNDILKPFLVVIVFCIITFI